MNTQVLHWFLPLDADVAQVGTAEEEEMTTDLDHLVEIAEAAQAAGCTSLLVPALYGSFFETFTAAAAVLARTSDLQLMLAVRPNQYHPAQAAKMIAGLERMFPGRVRLNVTSGGWPEDRWIGNDDDRETRYRRLHEWLEILQTVLYERGPVRLTRDVYWVDGTRTRPPVERRVPIAVSGSSPEARDALARYGDSYLMFAGPPADVAREIASVRSTPGWTDRHTIGLRSHIVVRPTEEQAWAAAEHIVSAIDPVIAAAVARRRPEVGSQRAAQHALATAPNHHVGPNLWTGIGAARLGVATAIVGDPEQVADRLEEYLAQGIDFFILSGYPKDAEARWFGDLVTPILRRRGILDAPARLVTEAS